MFIEKITKEDIQEFIGNDYKICQFEHDNNTKPYIMVNIVFRGSEYDVYQRFTDMEGMTNDIKWIKFMYHKFGDEYKELYINEQLKIFK